MDVVTGTWHFVKAIPGAVSGTYHYLQDLAVRYVDGDSYDFEQKVAAKTWEAAKTIAYISYQIQLNPTPIIEAIYQGSYEPLNRLAPEFRQAVEASVELIQELTKDFGNKTPYEQGTIIGDAVFQVLSIVLPMTKVGQLSKLAVLEKMNETAKFLNTATPLGKAFAPIKAAGGLLGKLQTTKMCFVAGTLVHTANGLVPIEQIHAGDLVLSRDEQTGTQAYKPVLNTIITHPDALYTVSYDRDGGGPLAPESVVTTAPHPFWVVDEQKFIATADLKLGEHFLLANGGTADVVGLTVADAPSGTTTYNFEVADFHTFFVGEDGVWVHNSGKGLCEQVFSLYRQIVETHNLQNSPWEAFKKLIEKTSKLSNRVSAALPDTVEEVMKDAYRVAKRADGTIDLTQVPTHAEAVTVMAGRLAPGALQSNHTIPRYVQKLFGINDATIQDTVPSLILQQVKHTGAGAGSFHNILYKYIPKGTPTGFYNNSQLLSKLEQAYVDFGRSDVWEVAREWLRLKGI